jgi:hypothetical protein
MSLFRPTKRAWRKSCPKDISGPKLIFIFPKEGGGGGIKHFSDTPFFTNLPKFVQFISNIFDNWSKFFLQLLLLKIMLNVMLNYIFLPDERVLTHPQGLRPYAFPNWSISERKLNYSKATKLQYTCLRPRLQKFDKLQHSRLFKMLN